MKSRDDLALPKKKQEWTFAKSLYAFSIGRRVFIAFTLTTAIAMVAISLLSIFYFNALVARDQAVKTAFAAQHSANDQQVNLQRMNALLRTRLAQVFATTGGTLQDPSLGASGGLISIDILTREITFEQTLSFYQQNYALKTADPMSGVRGIVYSDDPNIGIGDSQQAALTVVATSEWPRYRDLQDQVLQLLDPTNNPMLNTDTTKAYEQVYAIQFEANTLFISLANDWQHVVNSAETIGEIVTTVGPSQYQPIILSTSVALLFTFFVIMLVGYMVNVTITRPLRSLVTLTQRIAAGENNVRATVRGHDEIAQVAGSMNRMLDHIVKLIQESESQRARLQLQVEQMVHQVSGVGKGDLRAHADGTLPELGILAQSFNFMVNAFSSLIRGVKVVAYEVENSAEQMSQATNYLVASDKEQISQIQQALKEVDRMATLSQGVAQRARAMSTIVGDARKAADDGALSVQKTIDGMGRINETMRATTHKAQRLQGYSSSMNGISEVMGKLAKRTERLSLDAAIQVNMAGTSNTGFGPIVEDIRSLAAQTKLEAERIGKIAQAVVAEIMEVHQATHIASSELDELAKLVALAGQALEGIFSVVQRQTDEIQEMSTVARGQVQSSQRVVAVMQYVSTSTSQSSITTQNFATMVKRQGQLLTYLRTSVEVFKVREEQQANTIHSRNLGTYSGKSS